MIPVSKKRLVTLFLLFFAVQFYHTLTYQVHWPINPTNLFYKKASKQTSLYRFVLIDDAGTSQVVDPARAIPLERFRLGGIIRTALRNPKNPEARERFSRSMITRLNENPWRGFDEIASPALPSIGRHFVAFELQRHTFDLTTYTYPTTPTPTQIETVYTWHS